MSVTVNQGYLFWVDVDVPDGRRLAVVIQDDVMNASQIQTAVVCLLTGTLGRAGAPGNVLLDDGEADLPSRSVVNVSPIYTLHKSLLTDYIGRLAEQRVLQIARGVKQIIEPRRLQ